MVNSISNAMANLPICVAHRSIGYGELENSLSAFKAAIESNGKAIELDIRHTLDGKTMVFHDKVLDRLVTGANCPVAKEFNNLTYSEINDNCLLKNNEKIPTFEDALELLSRSDMVLFVELKDSISKDDFKLIRKYYAKRPDKIIFVSFKKKALAKVISQREQDSFFKDTKILKLTIFPNLLNFNGKASKYDGIDTSFIFKHRVKRIQKNDKLVSVYTKNTIKQFNRYNSIGVDFITTNRPKLCNSTLINKI